MVPRGEHKRKDVKRRKDVRKGHWKEEHQHEEPWKKDILEGKNMRRKKHWNKECGKEIRKKAGRKKDLVHQKVLVFDEFLVPHPEETSADHGEARTNGHGDNSPPNQLFKRGREGGSKR